METKHYIVENIAEFSEHIEAVKKLEEYLNYIEDVFPIIEEVFGREWRDDHIHIKLNNSKNGASYSRLNGIHTINLGIWNKKIQTENYPENLWGCLLHETLHAFMNPIIHLKVGSTNDLDKYYWDQEGKEPFIYSFQRLVYEVFYINKIVNKDLLGEFKRKLVNELGENAVKLYNRYCNLFLKDKINFVRFIKILGSSEKPLISKENFNNDLSKVEDEILNYAQSTH